MEKTHLFEHTDSLSDETKTTVNLIDGILIGGFEELTFNHTVNSKSKLIKCKAREVLIKFFMIFFAIVLILGLATVVYFINKHSQLQQPKLSTSSKSNFTNSGPIVSLGSASNVSKGDAESFFGSTRTENGPSSTALNRSDDIAGSIKAGNVPLTTTPSLTDNVSQTTFSCFSPWFTQRTSCYLFSKESKTWKDALASCEKEGGSLVRIEDSAENMFVRLYARTFYDDFWIGLSHQSKRHGWVWNRNTTPVMSSEYSSWAYDQQGSKFDDGDCVALTTRSVFLWDVRRCDVKIRYICEKHT